MTLCISCTLVLATSMVHTCWGQMLYIPGALEICPCNGGHHTYMVPCIWKLAAYILHACLAGWHWQQARCRRAGPDDMTFLDGACQALAGIM